jgi:hypothetical protein
LFSGALLISGRGGGRRERRGFHLKGSTDMPNRTVMAQDSQSFEPVNQPIRINRINPFGGAKFVVYNTTNKAQVFGAGDCPALTAHPPYKAINTGNAAFTVQALDGDINVQT